MFCTEDITVLVRRQRALKATVSVIIIENGKKDIDRELNETQLLISRTWRFIGHVGIGKTLQKMVSTM